MMDASFVSDTFYVWNSKTIIAYEMRRHATYKIHFYQKCRFLQWKYWYYRNLVLHSSNLLIKVLIYMTIWVLEFILLVFMSLKRMMFQPFKYRNISFVVMKMLEWKWENNVKDPIKLGKNSRLIFSFSTFGNGLCKGRNLQSLKIHCEVVYGYRPCTQNVF